MKRVRVRITKNARRTSLGRLLAGCDVMLPEREARGLVAMGMGEIIIADEPAKEPAKEPKAKPSTRRHRAASEPADHR